MTIPPGDLSLPAEADRFYAALGKSITQWQQVETALSFIFSTLVGRERSDIANVASNSILSFDSKLGIARLPR